MFGIHEESSYFPWLDTRIKLGSATLGVTVTAEKRTPATPASTADNSAFRLNYKIGAILDQLRVDTERST